MIDSAAPAAEPPVRLRLVRVRVPLRHSHVYARGSEQVRDSVLVGWTAASGVEGWGECPTLTTAGYATESTDQAWSGLLNVLAPAALVGRSALGAGLVAAAAALSDAALDARLRSQHRSLVEELGATRRRLPVGAVLAMVGAEPEQVAQAAVRAAHAGARLVKVKVVPNRAVEVITAVADALAAARAAFADDVGVAADANGSFPDAESVLRMGRALGEVPLAYLEQPLPVGVTPEELGRLRARLPFPLAVDESVTSLDALGALLESRAADVVSVKPARMGGVRSAAAAVSLCRDAGVGAFVGGMLETGVGRAAAAAVAALDGCTHPTDLGPSDRYFERDVTEPLVLDRDGRLVVPEGPGCGRVPLAERLTELTAEEVVLSR